MAIRIREALGALFTDEDFAEAFPARGRPAISPGALALVSVLQYAEGLSDRQAADQVRARMDWKFLLGLELDDPGFDFTVLGDFRARLITHGLEERVLEVVLTRLSQAGLLRAGGRQRTDSTHVLAAVRTLNRMEFVGETLRTALEALAAAAPDWLTPLIDSGWVERYGAKVDNYRFPKRENVRREWAEQVGRDGFALLDAIDGLTAPAWLREIPAVGILRRAWAEQYHRDGQEVRRREGKDLPPARDRLSSPYDIDAHYGIKRGAGWCGYKVHLSETCQPDAPHLITNVETTNATVNDTEVTATIHQQPAERELKPREHMVDAGYVTAAHILAARQDHGVDLVGPVGTDTHHQLHHEPWQVQVHRSGAHCCGPGPMPPGRQRGDEPAVPLVARRSGQQLVQRCLRPGPGRRGAGDGPGAVRGDEVHPHPAGGADRTPSAGRRARRLRPGVGDTAAGERPGGEQHSHGPRLPLHASARPSRPARPVCTPHRHAPSLPARCPGSAHPGSYGAVSRSMPTVPATGCGFGTAIHTPAATARAAASANRPRRPVAHLARNRTGSSTPAFVSRAASSDAPMDTAVRHHPPIPNTVCGSNRYTGQCHRYRL
ncbi:transposase [Streptomyces sp. CG4]|uniref:transposase n=1 Tax=Streptomyces sp. CG4 TaxID=408783 RepID=UPI0034E1AC39